MFDYTLQKNIPFLKLCPLKRESENDYQGVRNMTLEQAQVSKTKSNYSKLISLTPFLGQPGKPSKILDFQSKF